MHWTCELSFANADSSSNSQLQACRLAVQLKLNDYSRASLGETELHQHLRRNSERTYLLLFVSDRNLSSITGWNYMLHEDDFIEHSDGWHRNTDLAVSPEDVVVTAQVQLHRIAVCS